LRAGPTYRPAWGVRTLYQLVTPAVVYGTPNTLHTPRVSRPQIAFRAAAAFVPARNVGARDLRSAFAVVG